MDKTNYSNILKRVNSQLERARDSGSQSKVLACVDVNMLEAHTDNVREIIKTLRAAGWKIGTKHVPFTQSGVLRVPDIKELHKDKGILSRGQTGVRITVYHPSVLDTVIRNLNEYKYSKEVE
jgi:hypothetical protein